MPDSRLTVLSNRLTLDDRLVPENSIVPADRTMLENSMMPLDRNSMIPLDRTVPVDRSMPNSATNSVVPADRTMPENSMMPLDRAVPADRSMSNSATRMLQNLPSKTSREKSYAREKSYSLDKKKAIQKKIEACGREHLQIVPSDQHTCHFKFSSAFFEIFRGLVHSCFHVPLNHSTNTRHLVYDVDTDKQGLCTTEVIRVSNWQVVKKPRNSILNGSCKIIIHIYRTTSSALIQGKDSADMVYLLLPQIETLLRTQGPSARAANTALEKTLVDMGNNTEVSSPRNIHPAPKKPECTGNKLKEATCAKCNRVVRTRANTCDICLQTYHYVCEKLTPKEIESAANADSYTCKACTLTLTNLDSPRAPMQPALQPETQHPSQPSPKTKALPSTGNEDCTQLQASTITEPTSTTKLAAQVHSQASGNPIGWATGSAPMQDNDLSRTVLALPPPAEDVQEMSQPTQVHRPLSLIPADQRNIEHIQPRSPTASTSTTANLRDNITVDVTNTGREIVSSRLHAPAKPCTLKRSHKERLPEAPSACLMSERLPSTDPPCRCHEKEKELKAQEKILEKKANQLKAREYELGDKSLQMAALRAHVTQMEATVKELEEENRLLKIQVLCARTSQKETPTSQSSTPRPSDVPLLDQSLTALTHVLASVATLTGSINSLNTKLDMKTLTHDHCCRTRPSPVVQKNSRNQRKFPGKRTYSYSYSYPSEEDDQREYPRRGSHHAREQDYWNEFTPVIKDYNHNIVESQPKLSEPEVLQRYEVDDILSMQACEAEASSLPHPLHNDVEMLASHFEPTTEKEVRRTDKENYLRVSETISLINPPEWTDAEDPQQHFLWEKSLPWGLMPPTTRKSS